MFMDFGESRFHVLYTEVDFLRQAGEFVGCIVASQS